MAALPWTDGERTLRQALVITRREIRDQLRDWRILAPVLVLTVFFPALMNFTARQAVDFVGRYGAPVIADRLIPFLLMVVGFFPISVSLVIALESFAGEKERHSLEPLLSTPLSDTALYIGKMLASTVPPLVASYLGIGVYLTGLVLSVGWVPEPTLLIQVIVLTTVQALVMVSGAVVISTQTTSVRAANLLASFIIIPVALLVQAESLIMFWARYDVLWWIIFGLAMVDLVLVRMGVRLFNREELLGKEIDEINLRLAWRVFRGGFAGRAGGSIAGWYRGEVFPAVGRLRVPIAMVVLLLASAFVVGWRYASVFQLPTEFVRLDRLSGQFAESLSRFGLTKASGMLWILGTNLRALGLATLAGAFTFGVLGAVLLMLPLGLVGYFAGTVSLAGYSPLAFLVAFILPHGTLEIPAAVLVGAAVIRLGASLISPPAGRTVGEGWLLALADWAKIVVGLAIPLLLAAAALESFVTPRVVLAVFD